jgi:ATPase subunit of ABC transporter with duplicated ATPase domains
VVGYLKDFLFDEGQARAPVRSLSGGEKARLLLARIMARQSNLLVLDEPTNDLDVETLDLLQETLSGYDGTVLLVSHDRDFLDRVATVTVALEGGGKAVVYAGGWSDMMAQRQARGETDATEAARPVAAKKARPVVVETAPTPPPKPRLSFTETHRLAALPAEIARLEAEIAKLAEFLSDPEVYAKAPAKAEKAASRSPNVRRSSTPPRRNGSRWRKRPPVSGAQAGSGRRPAPSPRCRAPASARPGSPARRRGRNGRSARPTPAVPTARRTPRCRCRRWARSR